MPHHLWKSFLSSLPLWLGVCRCSQARQDVVLFEDNFDRPNELIDESRWTTPIGDPAFLGRTALRNWLRRSMQEELRIDPGGYVELPLDTYNRFAPPPTCSFYGTELDTVRCFGVGTGLGVEARVWIDPGMPRGTVSSLFLYKTTVNPANPCPGHIETDEIDFEFLSNFFDSPPRRVFTNVYRNECPGAGDPVIADTPGVMYCGTWNTFRINWYADRVDWLVNGGLVLSRPQLPVDGPLGVRLNVWVPACTWPLACDPALLCDHSAGTNRRWRYRVDRVTVYGLGCVADWNGSRSVDSQDYFDFLAAFFAAAGRADVNHDGAVNSQDFFDFVAAFFTGC